MVPLLRGIPSDLWKRGSDEIPFIFATFQRRRLAVPDIHQLYALALHKRFPKLNRHENWQFLLRRQEPLYEAKATDYRSHGNCSNNADRHSHRRNSNYKLYRLLPLERQPKQKVDKSWA